MLQFFHKGIMDRVIDNRARLEYHDFAETDSS